MLETTTKVANAICDETLEKNTIDIKLEHIKCESDFKKRIPLYFQLLLQDEEFDSIYNRMSSDGRWIFIDKGSNKQIIIKDSTHSFIEHCLVHYTYVFDGYQPFSRDQFFHYLRNKLFADLSSQELLDDLNSISLESRFPPMGFWKFLSTTWKSL